jgi:hypothetical protein
VTPALLLFVPAFVPAPGAEARLTDALSDPDRRGAVLELIAVLPVEAPSSVRAEVSRLRARMNPLGRAAVRVTPDHVDVAWSDASGRVDRLWVVYRDEAGGRIVHGRPLDRGLRVSRPSSWPDHGTLELHAGSSLTGEAALVIQTVRPPTAPPAPPLFTSLPGAETSSVALSVDPSPAPPALASGPPRWVWWTVGVATGALIGLGVWQETR